jgi:hypothetical protein
MSIACPGFHTPPVEKFAISVKKGTCRSVTSNWKIANEKAKREREGREREREERERVERTEREERTVLP